MRVPHSAPSCRAPRAGPAGLLRSDGPAGGTYRDGAPVHVSAFRTALCRVRLARATSGALGVILLAGAVTAGALDLGSRRHVAIVGSSTVYPIVAVAAEHFSRTSNYHSPVVESTGTGGGLKLFCAGVGLETPDVAMASRRMLEAEREDCRAQGVDEVAELKIGYDAIVFARAKDARLLELSTMDIYLGLAREVPDPAGAQRLVTNPYRRWNAVNPALPDLPIHVLGPPPTSGTRDLLAERVMEKACGQIGFLATLRQTDGEEFRRRCRALREDGAYVDAGENDARLVRKLIDDPGALGILGYNFLERNADRLQAARVDGERPDVASIQAEVYPLSRPLFLYVKIAHVGVVPGLGDFLRRVASEDAWGEDGYLEDQGLIPMPADERAKWARDFFENDNSSSGDEASGT